MYKRQVIERVAITVALVIVYHPLQIRNGFFIVLRIVSRRARVKEGLHLIRMHRAVNLIVNCSGIIRKLFRVHLIQRSRRSFCIAGLEACIGVNQKFIIIAFCFRRLFLCLSVSLQGIQLALQIIDLRLPGCQLIAVFPDLVRRCV